MLQLASQLITHQLASFRSITRAASPTLRSTHSGRSSGCPSAPAISPTIGQNQTTELPSLAVAAGDSVCVALVDPITPITPTPSPLAPLPPPETLEIHKRPESGEGPAKLGVVPIPDSPGVLAATDKHSRGDPPLTMDGLAVEVRGSNGAFYKVN